MNELKKDLSIFCTTLLSAGAAWAVASLFDLGFSISVPKVFWFALFLGLGLGVTWLTQRLRKGLTAKNLLGIVICVSLVLGLGFGLVTSVAYLINLKNKVITSFPWYWGFSFAEYLVGPVVAVCSVAWAVLHLKEDRRHVRDLKLIWILVMTVSALYGVYEVGRDVWYALKLPDHGLPWHARLLFGTPKYALLIGLESGVLWFLKRWEDNLRSGGDFDLPPKKKPPLPPMKRLWRFGDFAIVVLPLVIITTLMLCFLHTEHIWYNLLTVVGNALSVCLLFVTAAWLTAHHYSSRQRLNHLLWLNAGTILLTAVCAVAWTVWFNDNEIYPLTGLRADTAIHLGIAYFAPFVLGELLSFILILRLKKRLSPEKQPSDFLWWAVLITLCLLLGLGMHGMVVKTEYRHEVESTITEVKHDDRSGQLQFEVHPVVFIGATTFGAPDRQEGQAYYIDVSARWSPFLELKFFSYTCGVLADEEDICQVYIQKAPGVYALAAVKDPETGQWSLVEE